MSGDRTFLWRFVYMDFAKKTVLVAFLSVMTLAGCSNNTNDPNTDTQSSDTAVTDDTINGLQFTGDASGVSMNIIVADNYLSKIVNGNTYTTAPYVPSLTCDATKDKVEVTFTNFNYYGSQVDITCKMDPEIGAPSNKITFLPMGTAPDGSFGYYTLCDNGLYYFLEFPIVFPPLPTPVPQTYHHEINRLDIRDDVVLLCEGSDGNEYEASFYGTFEPSGLNIPSVLDIDEDVFTGVVSINLKNYDDDKIDLYFE